MPATQQPSARELLRAIEQNELRLHYQPIVSLQSEDLPVSGYEGLIRWQHPDRGLLFPGAFLPGVANFRASDFLWQQPLFEWVFEEACEKASIMRDDRYIALNLSPNQLISPEFYLKIKESLLRLSIVGKIKFEITEDAIATRDLAILQQALMPLSEWAALGIDDFGTQHSSMWRLSSLQGIINFLKIDRVFMPRDTKDVGAIAIYECFVKLAQVFSLRTVAEGIESITQLEICRAIGVDYAQGFYFSPAKAWEDLETVGYAIGETQAHRP